MLRVTFLLATFISLFTNSTITTAFEIKPYFNVIYEDTFEEINSSFFKKFRPLSTFSDAELAKIEELLNNRLRKGLGYKTPQEIFTISLNRAPLRA